MCPCCVCSRAGFRVWCWISLRRVVRELFETQFTELRAYFVWSLRGDSFSLGASTEFGRASAGLYTITNFVEEVSEVTAEKATAQRMKNKLSGSFQVSSVALGSQIVSVWFLWIRIGFLAFH